MFKSFRIDSCFNESRGREYKKKISILICDACLKEFERQRDCSDKERHYCDKKCLGAAFKRGGKADEARRKTFKSNWGTEDLCKSPKFIEKLKKAYEEKLGVENPFQLESVKLKSRSTMKERYGVEFSTQSQEIKEKIKKTNIAKLGVENPSQSPSIYAKIKQTNVLRYGFESAFSSADIQAKRKKTNVERYGFEHPHSNHIVRKKYEETMNKHVSHSTSAPEEKLYNIVVSIVGHERVQRWVWFEHCNFDMIIDENIIVQLDGVYWHGLYKPIDEIMKMSNPQACSIVKKYQRDREQDELLPTLGYYVIRLTDKFVNEKSDDEIYEKLTHILKSIEMRGAFSVLLQT